MQLFIKGFFTFDPKLILAIVRLFNKFTIIGFLFVCISCNSEPTICPDQQIPELRIAFSQIDEKDTINAMSIRLHNAEDFLLDIPNLNDTSKGYPDLISLPLNNDTDSFSLILDWFHTPNDTHVYHINSDTFFIKYNSDVILENLECDFFM